MLITIIILVLSAVFFVNGKVRSDIVALCALIALLIFQILTPDEALSGFSNSVVIMMIGLFVVGGAIFQTGLAKMISSRILKLAGTSEIRLFLLVMLVTSVIGKLGIVFQDFQLLTDRTVYNNLEFVLRATGWKNKQEIQDRIEEVLQLVGMSNKGYKLPNELSGGEQQRIVIARAVLNSPAIILADEPTGNLDVETGKAIVELLHNICESGSSVVMTTHNLQLLKDYPGRVYRCADHQIVDVTDEYMPRQRTIEIDLNIDN